MIDKVRSWTSQNATLAVFLLGQTVVAIATVVSIIAYMVRLETRTATLEIRGSPHLSEINNRLTVLESTTKDNKDRLQKIVDVMTKELHISPSR